MRCVLMSVLLAYAFAIAVRMQVHATEAAADHSGTTPRCMRALLASVALLAALPDA